MNDRVTLKSLAAELGVSASIISRVISGDRAVRITKVKRDRIHALVEATGYRPHYAGRSLRMGRSRILAFVIPDIANSFYSLLFRAVETAAMKQGYTVFLCNTDDDPARLETLLDVLGDGRVDGFLIASTRDSGHSLQRLEERKIPYVLVNRRPAEDTRSWIGPDDDQSGFLTAQHLRNLGHRRVAYIALDLRVSSFRRRLDGFMRGMQGKDELSEEPMVETAVDGRHARQLALKWLQAPVDQRPTAIVSAASVFTDSVLAVVRELELHIPGDLSVVAYNPLPNAQVSGIDVPVEKIGHLATDQIIDLIERRQSRRSKVELTIIPVTFVERGTTAAPRLAK